MFRYGAQNVLKCTRRYAAVLEQSSLYWKITVETVCTRTAALELVSLNPLYTTCMNCCSRAHDKSRALGITRTFADLQLNVHFYRSTVSHV
jgi:hypothetical protein